MSSRTLSTRGGSRCHGVSLGKMCTLNPPRLAPTPLCSPPPPPGSPSRRARAACFPAAASLTNIAPCFSLARRSAPRHRPERTVDSFKDFEKSQRTLVEVAFTSLPGVTAWWAVVGRRTSPYQWAWWRSLDAPVTPDIRRCYVWTLSCWHSCLRFIFVPSYKIDHPASEVRLKTKHQAATSLLFDNSVSLKFSKSSFVGLRKSSPHGSYTQTEIGACHFPQPALRQPLTLWPGGV